MDDLTQFNGTIGPGNLLSLVRNTAPYYFNEPFLSLAKWKPAPGGPADSAARSIDAPKAFGPPSSFGSGSNRQSRRADDEAAARPERLFGMAGHPFGWLDILLNAHTLRASGNPSSSATSSQVALPGVGTFCIGSDGAGRDAAGAIASASSTLAA